jgi:hypothetical protein
MKRFLLREFPDESERSSNIVRGDIMFALDFLERHAPSQAPCHDGDRYAGAPNDGLAVGDGRIEDNAVRDGHGVSNDSDLAELVECNHQDSVNSWFAELLNAKWSDIEWKQRTLSIPKTKNGEALLAPLSHAHGRILSASHIYARSAVQACVVGIHSNPIISDVGLAKAGKRVNIPTPDRGYRRAATSSVQLRLGSEDNALARSSKTCAPVRTYKSRPPETELETALTLATTPGRQSHTPAFRTIYSCQRSVMLLR